MITQDKVNAFIQYKGDGDMWVRLNDKPEKIITSDEWGLIDSLLQDLAIIKNGYASESFISNFHKKLKSNCDNANTINLIKSL